MKSIATKPHSSRSLAARHLSIAGFSWLVSLAGGVALGLALPRFGYAPELGMLATAFINLFTAYHLGKAATAQGRRGWIYGVLAGLWLMIALLIYMFLNISEMLRPSQRGRNPKHG